MPPIRVRGSDLSIRRNHIPRLQTPTPTVITAFFLRQIEANHVRTPSRGRPVPLQFNAMTQSLSEWAWPCDPDTEERVTPSELESFRRTHRFRAPSCLCALLDGAKYTESMIAIVETVTSDEGRNQSVLNGEYVACCAKKRCGYFLCLERFYSLNNLRLQICYPRKNELQPQEMASICDIDKSLRAGDGLFQLMTDVVARGPGSRLEKVNPTTAKKSKDALMNELVKGMSEERFWATFVQCLLCKTVTLRKNFALYHVCGANAGKGHPNSFPGPDAPAGSAASPLRVGSASGIPSSPTPTELIDSEHDVFGEVEFLHAGSFEADPDDVEVADDDQSDGVPSLLSDDFELPTLAEIMADVSTNRVRFDRA